MKRLRKACCSSLEQVLFVIHEIEKVCIEGNQNLYYQSGAGRHIRHILDHYLALKNGLENKLVDYNEHNRESRAEKDAEFALQIIAQLSNWISSLDDGSQQLSIESEIDCKEEFSQTFQSNLGRPDRDQQR